MKGCSYCGRQSADEAIRCRECGTSFVVERVPELTRKAKLAHGLMLAPFLVVPLVYVLMQVCMGYVAAHSPAPDQGAMVLGFLILGGFLLAGVASFITGLVLHLHYRSCHEI